MASPESAAAPRSRPRVLAVDDQLVDRKMVSRMLTNEGYDNFAVSGGREALEVLREATEAQEPFQVVLVDVNMPEMDGFQLLLELRRIYQQDIAIIMLSGDDDERTVQRCLRADADSYFTKPIRPQEIKLLWQYVYQRSQMARKITGETKRIGNLSQQIVDLELEVGKLKRERDTREARRRSLLQQRRHEAETQIGNLDHTSDPKPAAPPATRGRLQPVQYCRLCEEQVAAEQIAQHTEVCRAVTAAVLAASSGEQALTQASVEVRRALDAQMTVALHNAMAAFEAGAAPLQRLQTLVETAQTEANRLMAQSLGEPQERGEPQEGGGGVDFDLLARQAKLIGATAHGEAQWDVWRAARIAARAIRKQQTSGELLGALEAARLLRPDLSQELSSARNRVRNLRSSSTTSDDGVGGSGSDSGADEGSSVGVTLGDFVIVRPLSRGAYGSVYLARKKRTGDLYAIKVLQLRDVLRRGHLTNVNMERTILSLSSDCRFLTELYFSFRTHDNLFLVMDFLKGGDLSTLLVNLGAVEEEVAQFYVACTLEALGFLHAQQIVHRDVKPDNLLIGNDGFAQLTDFGLATRRHAAPPNDGEVHCVGTPGYIAPEIYLAQPHTEAADLWSLGCVLFELLCGSPPFIADTMEEVADLTLNAPLDFPLDDLGQHVCSEEAQDLIRRLLERDPEARLDVAGARRHPFFEGLDWSDPDSWQVPFVPDDATDYHEPRNAQAGAVVVHTSEGLQEALSVDSEIMDDGAADVAAVTDVDDVWLQDQLDEFDHTNLEALLRRTPLG